jgi:hypothetical protein
MTHHAGHPGRLALAVAMALALVGALPGAARADCSGTPSAPLAVDAAVFAGMKKGLIGADGIVVSTKLLNGAWTTFFDDDVSPSTVQAFALAPEMIPALQCGDVINLPSGRAGGKGGKNGKGAARRPRTPTGNVAVNYRVLKERWPPQSVIVLPVVTIDPQSGGTVEGFVVVRVNRIKASGNPKYLDGTILALDLAASSSD